MRESIVLPTFTTEFTGGIRGYYSNRFSRRSFLLDSAPAVAGGVAALGLAGLRSPNRREARRVRKRANLEQRVLAQKGEVKLYMFPRSGISSAGKPALPFCFWSMDLPRRIGRLT